MAKTLVIITSYNRQESLARLIAAIQTESDADIMVFDDCSTDGTRELLGNLAKLSDRINCYSFGSRRGKAEFWKTYNDIFGYCKEMGDAYDYYIILPDDVEPCPDFVSKAIEAYDQAGCICLSLLLRMR